MKNKNKLNFWLDIAIGGTFSITTLTGLMFWLVLPEGPGSSKYVLWGLPKSTWAAMHDWAGIIMLGGIGLHLILHWRWITCVAKGFFKRLTRRARLNFSLDSALCIIFAVVNVSGLIAWLALPSGYQGGRNPYYNATLFGLARHGWNEVHLWTGLAMIVLAVTHIALHWNWIVCMMQRYTADAVCRIQGDVATNECAV